MPSRFSFSSDKLLLKLFIKRQTKKKIPTEQNLNAILNYGFSKRISNVLD